MIDWIEEFNTWTLKKEWMDKRLDIYKNIYFNFTPGTLKSMKP